MNLSIYFKYPKKAIAVLIVMMQLTLYALGQTVIGVVDYMKVDNPDEYLKIENEWKKIHEERLKQGMIKGWAMYQVMFHTTDDPYNYITVSWYDSFSSLDKGVPDDIIHTAFPNMTKKEWKAFNDKTNNTRKLISQSIFHQRFTCAAEGLDSEGNFYLINEIRVKPGQSKELLQLYSDIYKPIFEEEIRNHNRSNWSFWEKWPGNSEGFQYLSADGYIDMDQIDHTKFVKYFNQIFPDKNIDEISERMEKLKTLINTEMWRKIYRVVK